MSHYKQAYKQLPCRKCGTKVNVGDDAKRVLCSKCTQEALREFLTKPPQVENLDAVLNQEVDLDHEDMVQAGLEDDD